MENNNIIEFPLHRRIKKIYEEEVELVNLENVADEVLSDMLSDLYDYGFNIDGEEFIYDISLLFETLRSLILNVNGYNHPIQNFAENLYTKKLIDDQEKNDPSQLEFDF